MDATATQYRNLTPEEADKLRTGDRVWILAANADTPFRGEVRGWHKNEAVRVVSRSGHVFEFDVDHPDYWHDGRVERMAPEAREDEQSYYLVTAVADDNLAGLLAASIPFVELQKRLGKVEEGIHRVNNILQADVPTRRQFEALASDYVLLEERVRALESLLRVKVA